MMNKRGEKDLDKKRNKKRPICKTRSLKPDYEPTMTQSLMFIPVIRCEEEDFCFIVVECIASPLSACLFRKHFPPPEARCNPCMGEPELPAASC